MTNRSHQFRIEASRCMGSGECVLAAPEVFQIGPDEVAVVLDGAPPLAESAAAILIEGCPSGAVHLVEVESS